MQTLRIRSTLCSSPLSFRSAQGYVTSIWRKPLYGTSISCHVRIPLMHHLCSSIHSHSTTIYSRRETSWDRWIAKLRSCTSVPTETAKHDRRGAADWPIGQRKASARSYDEIREVLHIAAFHERSKQGRLQFTYHLSNQFQLTEALAVSQQSPCGRRWLHNGMHLVFVIVA